MSGGIGGRCGVSDKPIGVWAWLQNWLRYQVGRFALWYCGPEGLYWVDPAQWEEYLAEGQGVDDE